ncbi:MAG: FHA domain-containing protein [Rhodobacteraceae bacterium]|nr:FHA domain-containing protein [Paracoccaceae bacterium]
MQPGDVQEKTLAKLSITALLLDAVIVFSIWYLVQPYFAKIFSRPWDFILPWYPAVLPALFVLYLFLVEVILGGFSVGRFCCGLTISNRRPTEGSVSWRMKRFMGILFRFGLGSLNPNRLPAYNCSEDLLFKSDMAGEACVRSRSRPASGRTANAEIKSRSKAATASHPRAVVTNLKVLSGSQKGSLVTLGHGRSFSSDGVYRIGRDPAWSDLVLADDLKVSSRHCRLQSVGGNYEVLDGDETGRKSTNGTHVSGRDISGGGPVSIKTGDIFQIGQTQIQLL